jgi:putative flippase GtrA
MGEPYYLLASGIGFIAGLCLNYPLSKAIVFTEAPKNGNSKFEFLVYGIIGVCGLLLTEILMHILCDAAQVESSLSRVITAAIVLVFNFTARKATLYTDQKIKRVKVKN